MPLSVPMARVPAASSGSFGMAGAAVESFTRQLAAELGPHGIRVVCLRPTGIPETAARRGGRPRGPRPRGCASRGVPLEQLLDTIGSGGLLQHPLTVDEVANVAAFMASDRSSGMTATVANVTLGGVVD